MKYKELGKKHTRIPVIGQGCMGIGGYLSRDTHQDNDQVKALRLGIELGMTFIDTADAYGNGHSEEVIGKAFAGKRDQVVIASKVGNRTMPDGSWAKDFSPSYQYSVILPSVRLRQA